MVTIYRVSRILLADLVQKKPLLKFDLETRSVINECKQLETRSVINECKQLEVQFSIDNVQNYTCFYQILFILLYAKIISTVVTKI